MKPWFFVVILLCISIFSTFTIATEVIATNQANNDVIITRNTYILRFVNGGPDVTFYNKIDVNDSQSRYRYTIQWGSLTEFKDNNNNGIYDNGSDTKVSSLNLNTLQFTSQKVSDINIQNGNKINGTDFEFNSTFTQNGQKGNLSIIYSWWNSTFVVHPYGNTGSSITVNSYQSKYSFVISGWKFSSPNDRLALDATIHTSNSLSGYNVLFYKNGTLSMITKNNPDGKGFRGGIIDNLDQAYNNNQLSPVNISVRQSGVNLFMQYAFSAFNGTLLYDPTYSAVSSVSAPSGSGASTIGNSNPLPDFTYGTALIGFFMIGIILIKIRKRQV